MSLYSDLDVSESVNPRVADLFQGNCLKGVSSVAQMASHQLFLSRSNRAFTYDNSVHFPEA